METSMSIWIPAFRAGMTQLTSPLQTEQSCFSDFQRRSRRIRSKKLKYKISEFLLTFVRFVVTSSLHLVSCKFAELCRVVDTRAKACE